MPMGGEALELAKYINVPGKGTTIAQALYGFVGDRETPPQYNDQSLISARRPAVKILLDFATCSEMNFSGRSAVQHSNPDSSGGDLSI
jgi:hypothetical protein